MKKTKYVILLAVIFTFTSCIGLSIDIQMNRDGSGRLAMEYRISRSLETLGALDGNAEMPAIPVSRADWDRTIARVTGARVVSFSTNRQGQDITSTVVLEFDKPDTLLAILDPYSSRAAVTTENNRNSLNLILNDSSLNSNYSEYDETLMELARMVFADYNFSISFSAPGNSTLRFVNGKGGEIQQPPSTEAVLTGRRVSMSIGIMDLIEMPDGIGVKFFW